MLYLDLAPTNVSHLRTVTIQWTAIVIAVCYGIHMIFMSTFSADLTVNEPPKSINRLKDLLYDDTFQNFTPTIFTHLNMYNVISKARNGTDKRVLIDRAMEKGAVLTLEIKMETALPTALEIFEEVSNHRRAIIEDSSILDIAINNVICHLLPEKALKFVKSNEEIYNSPQAMLISHSTHPQVVDLFLYRSLTGIEFGMVKGSFNSKIDGALGAAGIVKSLKGYVCTDTLQGYLYRDMDTPQWNPLPLFFFQRFLYICIGIIFCAMIVLIIDFFYKKFTATRTRKRIRPVSAKVITISCPSILQTVPRVSSALVRKRIASSIKMKK